MLFRFSANTLRLAVSCRFTVTVKNLQRKYLQSKDHLDFACILQQGMYIDAKSLTPSDNETTFPD